MIAEHLPEVAAQPEGTETRKQRILIIEDDEAMVRVLSYRLERLGFETISAHRGRQGLELALHETPSLVLLDLRLPDIDGFEVCEKLADSPETCLIPVIIVSGLEGPEIVRRARAAGSQFYVRKPYDPNALLVLIQNALRAVE